MTEQTMTEADQEREAAAYLSTLAARMVEQAQVEEQRGRHRMGDILRYEARKLSEGAQVLAAHAAPLNTRAKKRRVR